jgi:phage terminase large subunit-like protein
MSGWDLSCRDWEQRIADGRSLIPDLPLNREEADLAVAFFDQLRLPDVQGNPALAEAAGDWARDIVRALFGSYDPQTKARHVEEIFALVPKKNSKTTYLGAGLMLTALFMNQRPRAEFIFVGPTQAIADLAYSQADGMIGLDAELAKRFKRREHLKQIEDLATGAKLKIRTFDLNVLTGPRPAGVFIDELHLLGRNPATAKILRQLRGGRQSFPEGFLVIATTQSDDRPAGAFREELMAARAIRDGTRGGVMLAVLYEFPAAIAQDQERWSDPANWPMVLPNLGKSLRLDSLIQDFASESAKGEAAKRLWASQHLNIEIGLGLQSDRWAGADYWEGRGDQSLTLEKVIERSEVIVVGIDGGGMDDLLGLAVLGRDRDTREWLVWCHAWAHPAVLERRKSIASQLLDFARDGSLTIVDRLPDDITQVVDLVAQVEESGLLAAVGLDQIGIGGIIDALAERGIQNDEGGDQRVVGISQGWKLAGAIKTAERKLADGTLTHAGQPLMAWAVSNAKVEPRGNALMITKQTAGAAKIDPLIALFNAVALMGMNPEAICPRSVYEDRGILIF